MSEMKPLTEPLEWSSTGDHHVPANWKASIWFMFLLAGKLGGELKLGKTLLWRDYTFLSSWELRCIII